MNFNIWLSSLFFIVLYRILFQNSLASQYSKQDSNWIDYSKFLKKKKILPYKTYCFGDFYSNCIGPVLKHNPTNYFNASGVWNWNIFVVMLFIRCADFYTSLYFHLTTLELTLGMSWKVYRFYCTCELLLMLVT